jgi:hypothetical protein
LVLTITHVHSENTDSFLPSCSLRRESAVLELWQVTQERSAGRGRQQGP